MTPETKLLLSLWVLLILAITGIIVGAKIADHYAPKCQCCGAILP